MNAETSPHTAELAVKPKHLYQSLYVQVLTAIVVGVLLGHFYPTLGETMKPLGDAFIKLVKMIIAPVIFCTVVVGIAGMEDLKKVGARRPGAPLLRGRHHARADRRPHRRQRRPARRRHAHRSGHARCQRVSAYTGPGKMGGDGRLPAQHHPEHRRRRVRRGRHPAGAALLRCCSASRLQRLGERGTPVFDWRREDRRTCSSASSASS